MFCWRVIQVVSNLLPVYNRTRMRYVFSGVFYGQILLKRCKTIFISPTPISKTRPGITVMVITASINVSLEA